MESIMKMLSEIEHESRDHQGDIRILELLLKHAKCCMSRSDCGIEMLGAFGGDLVVTKAALALMQKEMNSMLLEWYAYAALSIKEGENKHD